MPLLLRVVWVFTPLFLGLVPTQSGRIYSAMPDRFEPTHRYVIYLHGRIIEDQGRRPTHSVWGTYEYDAILADFAKQGLDVISEQRPAGTDVDLFATRVADQVRALLAAGVAPERVAVVGFSKGGGIAIRVADLLHDDRLTFVFLGACGDGNFATSPLKVRGRILSIHETSDSIGRSCHGLFERAAGPSPRSELAIATNLQHGAFYQPRAPWFAPTVAWIYRR